jgi:hypothetical protein
VTQPTDPPPSDPFHKARKALEALGFQEDEQEALALIAALLENYSYSPSQIQVDRIPDIWAHRAGRLWTSPPGFRDSILDHILRVEYGRTQHFQTYTKAIEEARKLFRPAELSSQSARN